MANTYILITSTTLGSSAASVTFTGIPATYTDLLLKISARTDSISDASTLALSFNGSSASNYSRTTFRGNGASSSSSALSNNSIMGFLTLAQGGGTTANTFGDIEMYIPSYGLSQNKPFGVLGATENNSQTAYITAHAGLWRDTSAISSIQFTEGNSANFVAGSSFVLYGISKS